MWTHLRREASPLLRYRSADLGRVWTSPCACGRTTPRIRIDGRRDDMLRVQAVNVYPQAIGAILAAEPRLGPPLRRGRGRPDRAAAARVRRGARRTWTSRGVAERLHAALRARFAVTRLEPGLAARGRAQDPHRPSDRPRGPAAGRSRDTEEGDRPMTVTTADLGAARLITWDRQARRNAWDLQTMTEIADAIEAAGADKAVRCVVAARRGRALLGRRRPAGGDRGRHGRVGGDDRGLPAHDARGAGGTRARGRSDRRRVRGRRTRVRRELRPAALHRPRAPDHARGRNRAGGEQRRHAAAARRCSARPPRGSCC